MAAPVRIEDDAFSDVRYDVLATLCQLADADHARGKMAVLWRQCTAQNTYVLSAAVVCAVLGPRGAESIVESGLGEQVDAGIRIRGTRGRIEWLRKLKKNAQKGGRAKAAKRQKVGKREAAKSLPPPFPPTPTLTPTQKREGERETRPPDQPKTGPSLATELWTLHAERYAALNAALNAGLPGLLPAGHAVGWRDLRDRIAAFTGDTDAARKACMHVLEVREAEARKRRDLQYFGDKVWREDQFSHALSTKPPAARRPPVTSSNTPEVESRPYLDWLPANFGEE